MNVQIDFSKKMSGHVPFGLRLVVTKAIKEALEYESFSQPVRISVTFTDNEGIRELNRLYRDKDAATDVLSFPQYDFAAGEMPESEFCCPLGDIVLSLERARTQAREIGHGYRREVAFLTVHSVLHLLGYDHERSLEEEEEMCRRQREIMQRVRL